jgi:Ca-activated chloride channel family protein
LVFRKLLVFIVTVASAAVSFLFDPFLKWRKRKREIFAASQFHDHLFEKIQDLQNFFLHYICWEHYF